MNTPPKEFVVYWASKFNGKRPGYSTPMYQPNMLTFDNVEAAERLRSKLTELMRIEGTYRGRIVCHVAKCY